MIGDKSEVNNNITKQQPNFLLPQNDTIINGISAEFLDTMDTQQAASVNIQWNERNIKVVSFRENAKVSGFIKTLLNFIDEAKHPEIIKNLNKLLNENPISNSTNLIDLKHNFYYVKYIIANELLFLSNEELEILEKKSEISKHSYFNNIPNFIKIIILSERSQTFKGLSKELNQKLKDLFNKLSKEEAIELKKFLPEGTQSLILTILYRRLASENKNETAKKLLFENFELLLQFAKEKKEILDLNSFFEEVEDEYRNGLMFGTEQMETVISDLMKENEIEKAIELAAIIPVIMSSDEIRSNPLIVILDKMAASGDIKNLRRAWDSMPIHPHAPYQKEFDCLHQIIKHQNNQTTKQFIIEKLKDLFNESKIDKDEYIYKPELCTIRFGNFIMYFLKQCEVYQSDIGDKLKYFLKNNTNNEIVKIDQELDRNFDMLLNQKNADEAKEEIIKSSRKWVSIRVALKDSQINTEKLNQFDEEVYTKFKNFVECVSYKPDIIVRNKLLAYFYDILSKVPYIISQDRRLDLIEFCNEMH